MRRVQPFASRTGTRRNLASLREHGWGLLLAPEPDSAWRDEGFDLVCCDNGKWRAFSLGLPWCEATFLRFVAARAGRARFLVIPDVIGDGFASYALTVEWLPRLQGACPLLLIAVQDNMSPLDVDHLVGPGVGIFLGGSDAYKLKTMRPWGEYCARRGLYYHVGRVNTERRVRLAVDAGADSFDGSGPSRFEVTIAPLSRAAAQPSLVCPRRAVADA